MKHLFTPLGKSILGFIYSWKSFSNFSSSSTFLFCRLDTPTDLLKQNNRVYYIPRNFCYYYDHTLTPYIDNVRQHWMAVQQSRLLAQWKQTDKQKAQEQKSETLGLQVGSLFNTIKI